MVTASHNPMDYNGMKMVKAGSAPLDPETELGALKARAAAGRLDVAAEDGAVGPREVDELEGATGRSGLRREHLIAMEFGATE